MQIKVLNRDISSLKRYLDGKRRIMTYGAGAWANDIKKLLKECGYELNYAIVDAPFCNGNTFMDRYGGGPQQSRQSRSLIQSMIRWLM